MGKSERMIQIEGKEDAPSLTACFGKVIYFVLNDYKCVRINRDTYK